MEAETLLRAGQPREALAKLQEAIRKNPADPKLRVFLFQLLSVLGQWERAMTQLNVAAEMDSATLLMAEMYRPVLNAEVLRADIFAGERSPMIFGEPEDWIGWLVQANALAASGQYAAAQELRLKAFDAAPAVAGAIDGQPFEWLADADPRLGPVVEAVVDAKYYWIPMARIHRIAIEPPADLRDAVWTPVRFTWANGGTSVGLIPTRYPNSHASEDPGIQLARRTDWVEPDPEFFYPLGQRLLTTDSGDYPLMATRDVVLGDPPQGLDSPTPAAAESADG